MSCRLLGKPAAEHTLLDDRESCFWVLLWITLNYSKTKLSKDDLKQMQKAFDFASPGETFVEGGDLKISRFFVSETRHIILPEARSGLQELIATLQRAFGNRYRPVDSQEEEEKRSNKVGTMEDHSWLNKEFQNHLNMGNWPDSDEALDPNATASSHKRNSIQAGLELGDSERAKGPRSSHLSKVASVGNSDQGE